MEVILLKFYNEANLQRRKSQIHNSQKVLIIKDMRSGFISGARHRFEEQDRSSRGGIFQRKKTIAF